MNAEWRKLMQAADENARLQESATANGESPARPSWWRRVIGR
jgi:hypothetical protein